MSIDYDSELDSRAQKITERFSEAIHLLSHEPSLAFYRLEEHVRKSLPVLVEKRLEASKLNSGLTGACFDVESCVKAVHEMNRSGPILKNIHEMLKSSMFLKQQLDYERVRRDPSRRREGSSTGLSGRRKDSYEDSLFQELRKTKSLGYLKTDSIVIPSSAAVPGGGAPSRVDSNEESSDLASASGGSGGEKSRILKTGIRNQQPKTYISVEHRKTSVGDTQVHGNDPGVSGVPTVGDKPPRRHQSVNEEGLLLSGADINEIQCVDVAPSSAPVKAEAVPSKATSMKAESTTRRKSRATFTASSKTISFSDGK